MSLAIAAFDSPVAESVAYAPMVQSNLDAIVYLTERSDDAAFLRGQGKLGIARPDSGAWTRETLMSLRDRRCVILRTDFGGSDWDSRDRDALATVAERVVVLIPVDFRNRVAPPVDFAEMFARGYDTASLDIEAKNALNAESDEEEEDSADTAYRASDARASRSMQSSSTSLDDEDDRPALVREFPKPPAEAAWYGPAGELARAVEPFTEADPVGILVQTLVAFGCLWGRRAFFQVGSTSHYGNLYACTAGLTSAGRKGTAWDIVRTAITTCDPDFSKSRIMGGLSSGEGLIFQVRDRVTKKEAVRERGRVVDYQEVIADDGVADKRLLIVETEFGRTLAAMGREGNTLSSIMRQAWDSGNLDCLTKGNTNRATDAHISIVAHVTEQEVNRLLTSIDAANGFANRFLWAAVRKTKSLPKGEQIPDVAIEGPVGRMRRAAAEIPQQALKLCRSLDAERLWAEVYDSLAPGRPGLIGSILGRGQPQTMRLAMNYSLLDGEHQVGRRHLEAAIALWEYCARSAEFIFGDALGDRDADKLLSALRSAPEGLSRTTIRDSVYGRNKTAEELDRILGRLVEAKLIRSKVVPTGGRNRTVWFSGDACRLPLRRPEDEGKRRLTEGLIERSA